ncbi:hypothetical protein Ancab_026832 [Ancistrocladus abbreviatus]
MPIEMPRGLPFSVDTWTPPSRRKRHHFLSHAHKDHCSGITAYSSYPIYSTHLTKSLLLLYFPQLDESLFVDIEVGQSVMIDDPDGAFSVTAFDANHCPGAVMFLFEGSFGNILHTGDCRLTPECLQNLPERYLGRKVEDPKCRLNYVFLDCTFGKLPLRIPSKHSAIQEVTNCIWRHPQAPVVYLTCDLLGQEEILVNVSRTFGSKIYVDKVKNRECHQVLMLLAPDILSEDPSPRFQLFYGFPKLYDRAQQKLSEAQAKMQPEPLIVRPSAQWYACEEMELSATERRRIERSNEAVKDQFGVWHVCYSMHSSKQELEWALELLAPKWVVSTTPSCRAMELEYVKKHCFGTEVASDDPLWKLLDIRVDASSKSNIPEECDSDELKFPIVEGINRGIGECELQLPKPSSTQRGFLKFSPPTKRPQVTLFGPARLEFDFCNLYEEKKIISVKEATLSLMTDQSEQTLSSQKDNDGVESKEFSENSKLDVVEVVQDTSMTRESGVCRSVLNLPIGSSKCYNDNLRTLYRSMNVPVPQPLPSLVELMKTNKRPKWLLEL